MGFTWCLPFESETLLGIFEELTKYKIFLDTAFDLVITVCDAAKESCPMFPKATKT